MNVMLSFDSILSQMTITDQLYIMPIAILIGGLLMILLPDTASDFFCAKTQYMKY
ncbi:MAG: putative tellurium resistance membrane protein TerC [Arenicella sp.]|jgi:predicted tellurium resistance membrane protein TerC